MSHWLIAGTSLFTAISFAVADPAWPNAGNSDSNAVHACISNKDGTTRSVGITGTCKNNETAAHWNIIGPPGPTGPSVYDAEDRRVGTIISLSQGAGFLPIGTVPVVRAGSPAADRQA